jgi:hypothetical protein
LYPAFAEVSIDKTPSSFARLSRSSVVTWLVDEFTMLALLP